MEVGEEEGVCNMCVHTCMYVCAHAYMHVWCVHVCVGTCVHGWVCTFSLGQLYCPKIDLSSPSSTFNCSITFTQS